MESAVLEMKPVSLFEVKSIIKERKAEKELNYEQELTMKFVDKFAKLTEKQTNDLIDALKEISFLKGKDEAIYEIASVLPIRTEQLQLILPKEVTATEDELKQVIELTKKFEEKME